MITFATQKAIKMLNVDCFEEQDVVMMDYAPTTTEEANRRIMEAERGIANGEVVLHAEVMSYSYELLKHYGC